MLVPLKICHMRRSRRSRKINPIMGQRWDTLPTATPNDAGLDPTNSCQAIACNWQTVHWAPIVDR